MELPSLKKVQHSCTEVNAANSSPYGSFPAAASGFQWSFPARNALGL
jgi:hypothetical protein